MLADRQEGLRKQERCALLACQRPSCESPPAAAFLPTVVRPSFPSGLPKALMPPAFLTESFLPTRSVGRHFIYS
jgi:hypothetical protein